MSKSQVLKIVAMIVAVAALVLVFAACVNTGDAATIKEYRVQEAEFSVGDTFTKASITINALLTDGTLRTLKSDLVDFPRDYRTVLELAKEDDNGAEVWKFTKAGTYNITVNYLGDDINVEIVVE